MTYTWISVVEDALARVDESLGSTLPGLDERELTARPGPDANPVGWLAWHLTRVLDDHLATLVDGTQVWEEWRDRFDLPYDADDTGFGHSRDEVGAFTADPELLTGYWSATWERARQVLRGLADDDPERIVDDAWDPPVTLAARMVSLVNETTQHVGQVGYATGLLRS